MAGRGLMEATPLAMEHQHLVVVVNLLGVPILRELRFQDGMGRPDVDLGRQ